MRCKLMRHCSKMVRNEAIKKKKLKRKREYKSSDWIAWMKKEN